MGSGYPPDPQFPQDSEEKNDATMPGGDQQPVRLRMLLGPDIGRVYTMTGDTLTIGRAGDNDIVLDDAQVSRYHARVMRRGDEIIVEDLGSTNGTLVNERRIAGAHVLQPTEVIAVGSTLFSVEGFPAPSTKGMPPYRPEVSEPQPATPPPATPSGKRVDRTPWLAIGGVGGLIILVMVILVLAGLTAWLLTRDRVQVTPTIPNVFIQSPVAGSKVKVNQPVVVSAIASDSNGVTRVELRVGGNVVDQQQSAVTEGQQTLPANLQWTPTAPGTYTLEVYAYNSMGMSSAPTTVMVIAGDGEAAAATPTPEPEESPTVGGPPMAVTTADLNVREGPGEVFPVINVLPVGTQVQVTGKNADSTWWEIIYPPDSGGRGWIYAPFTRPSNTDDVPVVNTPFPPTATYTPTFTPTPTASASPTHTPTPTETPTHTPTIGPNPIVEFGATETTINSGQCSTLQWHIENVQAAYLNGGEFSNLGVTGPFGEREVCPAGTTLYILRAETAQGPIERSVTVTVRTEQTTTFNHVSGGWVQDNGEVSTPGPYVGDTDENHTRRAFFAFDLSSLNDAQVIEAQLDLSDYELRGDPFASLPPLYVEEVNWGSTLDADDYNASANANLATLNGAAGLDGSINVTARVVSAVEGGGNAFRIRLRFETASDDDDTDDGVNWTGRTAKLTVRYYQ